jgi:hypothetical protein
MHFRFTIILSWQSKKECFESSEGVVTLPDDFDDRKDLVEAVVERYEIQSNDI